MTRCGKQLMVVMVVLTSVLIGSAPVSGETLESVQKKIHDLTSRCKSISFKTHVSGKIEMQGLSLATETDMAVEATRQGDKYLSRIETASAIVKKFGGQDEKTTSTILSVSDGQYNYTYTESAGQKSAIRQKADPAKDFNPFDTQKTFKDLEKDFTVKLLPDANVDGKPCFVLEMTSKGQAAQAGVTRTVSRFDKATGFSLKSETFDKDGKIMNESVTTNVKIDAQIPAERFKFKAPAGVTIQDMPS